jgi:hypothetical protein
LGDGGTAELAEPDDRSDLADAEKIVAGAQGIPGPPARRPLGLDAGNVARMVRELGRRAGLAAHSGDEMLAGGGVGEKSLAAVRAAPARLGLSLRDD